MPKAKAKCKGKAKAAPKALANGVTPVDPMGPDALKKELGTLSGSMRLIKKSDFEKPLATPGDVYPLFKIVSCWYDSNKGAHNNKPQLLEAKILTNTKSQLALIDFKL